MKILIHIPGAQRLAASPGKRATQYAGLRDQPGMFKETKWCANHNPNFPSFTSNRTRRSRRWPARPCKATSRSPQGRFRFPERGKPKKAVSMRPRRAELSSTRLDAFSKEFTPVTRLSRKICRCYHKSRGQISISRLKRYCQLEIIRLSQLFKPPQAIIRNLRCDKGQDGGGYHLGTKIGFLQAFARRKTKTGQRL